MAFRGLLVTFALVLGALVPVAVPGAGAEPPKAGQVAVPDLVGDVKVNAAAPGIGGAAADGLDLTEARLFGETGERLWVEFTLKDLKAESNVPQPVSNGVLLFACLGYGGKTFAVKVQYTFYLTSDATFAPNLVEGVFGVVDGGCAETGVVLGATAPITSSVILDAEASKVRASFTKRDFRNVLKEGDPPPVGSQLTSFFALARDYRGNRFDVAGPAAEALTLVFPPANQDLRLEANVNIAIPFPCAENRDLPTYAIEAGGKRGIPISVSNLRPERVVNFTATTMQGPDWKPRIMPGILVPAATPEGPGNVTVNVIVDIPAGTKHKACATLRVQAIDAGDPSTLGETSLNVVSVVPPARDRNTLFLHSAATATTVCNGSGVWMNVDPNDPADEKQAVAFEDCEQVDYLSLSRSGLQIYVDVNPSHDLILNTTAVNQKATAMLRFSSAGIPTNAEVKVFLLSTTRTVEVIGESDKKPVDIGTSPTDVTFDIPIAFTRDLVASGDPSRLVDSAGRLSLFIQYAPRPLDENAEQARVAGRVSLHTDGSKVTLPIWATVKRNVVEAGAAGGLISLKVLDAAQGIANPGKVRIFNFTVLNEGAATDIAAISATVVGGSGNWTTTLAPPGPFTLAPGLGATFAVGVTPPPDARESETVRIDVEATSQSDPTARATRSITVQATQGQVLPDQTLGIVKDLDSKKGLPGFEFAFLAVAALAAWAWRRR